MLTFRRAEERGRANFGWLDSRHSFSFGHYYDPEHMGFRLCASSTTIAWPRAAAFPPIRTATWRSSPTCSKAGWPTRTASAPAR